MVCMATDGENKFEDMFIHFDRMYEHDRQTDTPHDSVGRAEKI